MIIENIEDFSPCINCQTKECGLVDGNECDRCNEFFKLKRTIEQAEVVVHAHWIKAPWIEDEHRKYGTVCSNCNEAANSDNLYGGYYATTYCPHCGAKMDGDA